MNDKPKKIIFDRKLLEAIGFGAILILFFFVFEHIDIPDHFQIFFTLLIAGEILYVLSLSIHKKKFKEKEFIFLCGLIIIINRLYDPEVFHSTFSIPLTTGCIAVFSVVLFRIFLPVLTSGIIWIIQHTGNDYEPTAKKGVLPVQSMAFQQQSSTTSVPFNNNEKEPEEKDVAEPTKHRLEWTKPFVAIIIVGASLWLSSIIVKPLLTYKSTDIERITGNLHALLSFIFIFITITVVIFLIVCTYIYLFKMLLDILYKKESPAVYAVGLLILSIYLLRSGAFTQNDLLNLISKGDLFSPTITALIIYPVFVIGANTINHLVRSNELILIKTNELAKRVLGIGSDILNSTISLVEFVTSDFLQSVLDIINKEDGDNSTEDGAEEEEHA